jgi:creatinine amidohydrolase
METSVGLELFPHLVELGQAGDGKVRPFRFEALRKGWVTTSRSFARLNDHCAAGEPEGATAAAGKVYLDLVCDRVSKFLISLGKIPTDPSFPHCDSVKQEE